MGERLSNEKRLAYVLNLESRELLFLLQTVYNLHIQNGIHTAWNVGYDAAIDEHHGHDYGLEPNPYE